MGLVKERAFNAINAVPIDIFETFERGRAELERTAIEHHCPTHLVNAPQATTVGTTLVPTQQIPVVIHIPELELMNF